MESWTDHFIQCLDFSASRRRNPFNTGARTHIHKCRNAFVCQYHRIYVSVSVLREMPHIHAYIYECLKRQRLAEMNGEKSVDSLGSESSTAVKDCRSLRPITGRPTSRSYFCFIVRLCGCHVSPQFGFRLSTATLFTVAALNVQHSAFGVNCITRQTVLPYYRRKRKVN